MSTVCVMGLGYIGLPTAAMLAGAGHTVIGVDINERIVSKVNEEKSHFQEPDLDMLLEAAVKTGRLKAQTTPCKADYFIIAVPTPFKDGRKPDMSYVEAATAAIAPLVQPGDTIILESTSPVGTTEAIVETLRNARSDLILPRYKDTERQAGQVHVAHCPERILPGQMVRELVSNDRIVGGISEPCAQKAAELYASFAQSECFITDCRTAEFVKLIENAFRDVNIAFANEVSVVCDKFGIDVWSAIELANRHPRVSILSPGPGVGGHCIAVDPWFLVTAAPESTPLMHTARNVNDGKLDYTLNKIVAAANRFRDPRVAIFGLTYKPDVDDLRESPALQIAERLATETTFELFVVDPMIQKLPPKLALSARVKLVDADQARAEADVVAFLVKHKPFRRLNARTFLNKIVIDAVGLMSSQA